MAFVNEHVPAALDHIVVAGNSVAVVEGRRMNIVAGDKEVAEAVAGRIEAADRVVVVMFQVWEVVEGIVEDCMGWLGEPRDMEAATVQGMQAAQPARTSRICS